HAISSIARLPACQSRVAGAPAVEDTPRMDALTRLVHLLALAVYLGSTVALVLVLLPAASAVEDPALRRRVLARGLKPYNVLSVGALGVLILTGASSLTDWKRALGPAYGGLLWPLVGKLSLTFALTMVGTWRSFGIAHRLPGAGVGGVVRGAGGGGGRSVDAPGPPNQPPSSGRPPCSVNISLPRPLHGPLHPRPRPPHLLAREDEEEWPRRHAELR